MTCETPIRAALVVLLALTQAGAADAPLALGPATTVIVIPQNADRAENTAASLLQQWLGRVTGSAEGFPIQHIGQWKQESDQVVISVGATPWGDDPRLAQVDDDGFVITRRDNVIVIAGKTPEASHYGVVRFLDRYAGVRFYLPGELWTSCPNVEAVVYDGPDTVETPFVTSLFLSGLAMDDRDEYAWIRRNAGLRRKGGTHQHNIFEMFPPERFAQTHPEIYPIKDGTRVIPQGPRDQSWQLNFSAPNLQEAARESINAFFAKNPSHRYVAISLNDGGRWDESPATQQFISQYLAANPQATRDHATSEQYWRFMAELARWMGEAHPGKRLVGLAYGPTRMPPSFKLPDNLTPFTNLHVGQLPNDHLIEAPAGQTPWVDQWLSVASHLGNHDWYQGGGYLIPRIYTGYWVQFLGALQQRLPHTYQHVECYPNWGSDGPKLYIMTRLMWNPQLDPRQLLRQFTDDMFGPASSAMFDYFVQLEDLWAQLNIVDGPERKLGRWGTQFNTTPTSRVMLRHCRELLDQAAGQLQSEPARARFALLERSFAFSEAMFALAAAATPDESLRDRGLAIAAELQENRRAFRYGQRDLEAAVKAVFWEKTKNQMSPLRVPRSKLPALGQSERWSGVAEGGNFVTESGGRDPQSTTIQIAHDDQHLFLRVECPRQDMSSLVESHNRDWRSDNVEVFFDLDGDLQKMERQLWVKATGEVVDWSKQAMQSTTELVGQVQKLADRYIVEIVVPFRFLDRGPLDGTLGIRVLRNEFTFIRGRNELTYCANWSRRLSFAE